MAVGILCDDGELDVVSVWVSPEYRGTGVAQQIMEGVEGWGTQHGATHARLDVESGNERAGRFYSRLGYAATGMRETYPGRVWLQRVLLRKELVDFMAALERDAARMQLVVADADLDAPVPTCPGWTVRDLVVHTGIVHRHKAATVRDMLTEGPPDQPDDPDGDIIEWFNEGVEGMLAVFSAANLDAPTWTWCRHDHAARWCVRRMAHETLIHGVDAAIAVGNAPEVDESLCQDGIEEILTEMMVGAPDWGEVALGDHSIELVTPGRSWSLRMTTWSGESPNTGNVYENEPGIAVIDPVADPDASICGTAAQLDLWLWGRGELPDGAITGNSDLAKLVRAIAVEATQ
jgi:uncharacterized protein (TIGR03083 family)